MALSQRLLVTVNFSSVRSSVINRCPILYIYIYIYTTSQNYLVTPQIVISYPESVIFNKTILVPHSFYLLSTSIFEPQWIQINAPPIFLKLLIHQNDPLWSLSLLHNFSAFFPLNIGEGLKIVLPSFPARVARGEPHIWVVQLWLFGQLKDVLFLFTFNVPLAEFTSMLWAIILDEYKSLSHKPRSTWDRVMQQRCCDSQSDSICPSPSVNPRFCIWRKPPPHHVLRLVWYREFQLFHQLFTTHRPSHLTQRFWTLIHQF